MRKSLLLYLFILAVLLNIFTYAYFSRKSAAQSKPAAAADATETKKLKDSIDVMFNQLTDANYFSLENDQNAQNYIVNNELDKIIPYEQFSTEVINQLMSFNEKPEGNPFTGQTKMTDKKFIINKARVLNHRWIIADFTDGDYWGEAVIKYFINPDKTVSFEVAESLIYQK